MKQSMKRSCHADQVADVIKDVQRLEKKKEVAKDGEVERPIKLDTTLGTLRDRTVGWMVQAYHDVNKPDLFKKV